MENHKTKTINYYPSEFIEFNQNSNQFIFHTKEASLVVVFLSKDIIQLRYAPEGDFDKGTSYAIDPEFQVNAPVCTFKEHKSSYALITNELTCYINKKDLRCKVENAEGQTLIEDDKGFSWQQSFHEGIKMVSCSKKIQKDEFFYGLGDKPSELNLKGKVFNNFNTDPSGYDKEDDPVYKSIPFFTGIKNGLSYGLFFDNTYPAFFDFGKQKSRQLLFGAYGGEMNYYFIKGKTLTEVVANYNLLTGTPELPPLWALGYHQSKWSYDSEAAVKNIAHQLRSRKIPADAIYLDIDYMNDYRCFTWNYSNFPDPGKMINELAEEGFHIVSIIDPGIKIDNDYYVCNDGLQKDVFCKRADNQLLKGTVWPGKCYFPDFTNKKVRKWWAGLYKGLLKDDGISGIWNDMNEPVTFEGNTFPDHTRHDLDGNPSSHRKAHNIYGMQMAKASMEGLKKYRRNKRPFNISRAAYAGIQRYSCVWTGDNKATWQHLWLASVQCQRLSISGVSFCGSDIGGFFGAPDGELFARWIQLAVFHPFFRSHCAGDHGAKEPWVFGKKIEDISRKYIELRYQLLPYIYTTFMQYAYNGTPMIKPLVYVDQHDNETYNKDNEFMLGDQLLTAPVIRKGAKTTKLYLPEGNWFNYWDDNIFNGKQNVTVKTPLDICPLFIRSGAVIPHFPVMQYTNQKKVDPLYLHVYYTEDENQSVLYEDAGDGYGYKNKNYAYKHFQVKGSKSHLEIYQNKEGRYKPDYKYYELIVHGLPFYPEKCLVDGFTYEVKSEKRRNKNILRIWIPAGFNKIIIEKA